MQAKHEWEERYEQKKLPWDTGRPDSQLMQLLSRWPKCGGNVLEIGCGTGTNAVWLAEQGFQVTGMDISSNAIAVARQRAKEKGVDCTFTDGDFLVSPVEVSRQFSLIFDRGCFHVMGSDERRHLFVQQVAARLVQGGLWFSLIGNKDQVMDDEGPPRLSAAQICAAVEPSFEVLQLESCTFDSNKSVPMRFWKCLMKVRK
jgi:2-polyprenyl-3-methyl-5-hydroxy-6-metoxy-1,4-benzoquinol methylase